MRNWGGLLFSALQNFFWFRRDLRLHDNTGLYHALQAGHVQGIFIFDTEILSSLPERADARVTFIHDAISALKEKLESLGASLIVRYGDPLKIWPAILDEHDVQAVFTNRDFEPYANARDNAVAELLQQSKVAFHTFKDHVMFEKDAVLKDDGKPYTVFTPYSRKWVARLGSKIQETPLGPQPFYLQSFPSEDHLQRFEPSKPLPMPSLADMGFERSALVFPPAQVGQQLIKNYGQTRDLPAVQGTSGLGVHFRFGTISIREKARKAISLSPVFLNELIWRDFYSQILAHFPTVVNHPFKPQYDRIPWRDAPEDFQKWCEGKTGYPIVDAGMRELMHTGFMHNRVRMITASFLTKHLLIDWRLGEAWFAQNLLDFDLASNNGGWQWAAGCGTDAAPYFRIFNPAEQTKKFDKDHQYIRRWVPEFGTAAYPPPMVDHAFARARCLDTYKRALADG
ncbi:MAG: deoxyribodipyrimidine photo-lyase [Lewinellaceae bacterium]|nr:deoxyribodipyrimidine photo-lyase [Lewinellaceae bacterium]